MRTTVNNNHLFQDCICFLSLFCGCREEMECQDSEGSLDEEENGYELNQVFGLYRESLETTSLVLIRKEETKLSRCVTAIILKKS